MPALTNVARLILKLNVFKKKPLCSCSTQSIVAKAGATHPGYYHCQYSVIYGVEIAYTLITFIRWRLLNAALVYTSALVIKNSLGLFVPAPDCFYDSHKYTVVYL